MAATAKKVEEIVEEPEAKVDTTVEIDIPDGGIGSFAMSEEDFETLEAEETKKEFGESGLAQFTAVAKKMAGHGRFGDDSVAHIQTGEMVVPLTLLESNPALKAQIFEQLRESGIEDPEQYVVGSKANNINPETGLMEFGFFSNLWSSVKSAFKSVVNVIKKIAPIVLPILLSMTPLGPIYGAAMGSGIATLANGGSLGDAFKSALVSGAMGAATTGFTGKGKFFENVSNAAADPMARAGATWEGAKSSLSGGGFKGDGNLFSEYMPTAEVPEVTSAAQTTSDLPPSMRSGESLPPQLQGDQRLAQTINPLPSTDPSFMDKAGDYMFRGGETEAALAKSATEAGEAYLLNTPKAMQTVANFEAAKAAVAPGIMATWGPSVAAGTVAMGLAGGFKTPEEEDLDLVDRNEDGSVTTGSDLIAANPGDYLIHDLGSKRLNLKTGKYEDVEDYMAYKAPTMPVNYGQNMGNYVQAAADGGPIYPRRNGGVLPDEGVKGKDSVRAMLMPGEFVMTTDAVRGLGNGNINNGIKSMYSVMRNLENRGRTTA